MVASNALPLVVRHIYSSPEALAKIRAELASVKGHVKIANMIHRHDEPCDLPYLEAAILEALRLSPTFGLSLGRIVPATGCQLNDFFIPPGYTVSMSGWAVNIDKNYFGKDAKEFKPERWIGSHPTELAKDGSGLPRTMRNYLEAGWLTFGAGSRVCIGRHLSIIAFTKFVADMVRQFDIEVVKEPYLWYGLIQHTEDMMIKAKVRDDTGHGTDGLEG
jgi:cytochrome P450